MTSMEPTGTVGQSAEAIVRGSIVEQDVALEHRRQSERRVAQAPDLVTIRGLKMHFPVNEGAFFSGAVAHVRAVDGISFTIRKGETLGLVGESGCGKTTTGRCILRLEHPTAGEILFDGRNLVDLDQKSMRALRQKIQVIFQDPYSSLNPRMKIGEIISEPMQVHRTEPNKAARDARVTELLRLWAWTRGLPTAIPTK